MAVDAIARDEAGVGVEPRARPVFRKENAGLLRTHAPVVVIQVGAFPREAERRLEGPAASPDRATVVRVELVAVVTVARVLVSGDLQVAPVAVSQELGADLERVVAVGHVDLRDRLGAEAEDRYVLGVGLTEEDPIAVDPADEIQREAFVVAKRIADVAVVEEPP